MASTEKEPRETAEFRYRAGWRDRVVSNGEIRCGGCGSRRSCAFMILPCMKEKGVSACKDCAEYPSGKIVDMFRRLEIKETECRTDCGDSGEWELPKHAFYENGKIRASGRKILFRNMPDGRNFDEMA